MEVETLPLPAHTVICCITLILGTTFYVGCGCPNIGLGAAYPVGLSFGGELETAGR